MSLKPNLYLPLRATTVAQMTQCDNIPMMYQTVVAAPRLSVNCMCSVLLKISLLAAVSGKQLKLHIKASRGAVQR